MNRRRAAGAGITARQVPDGGDFIIGRLDGSTGTPEWSQQLGDNIHDERAADIAIDRYGRVVVAGHLESVPGGHLDAFLLVLDRDGQPLGHELWASDGDDIPTGIAVDDCGRVVIVGETTGALVGNGCKAPGRSEPARLDR